MYKETLKNLGVVEIDPVGEKFDPYQEQSLGQAFPKACGVSGQRPEQRPDARSAEREII